MIPDETKFNKLQRMQSSITHLENENKHSTTNTINNIQLENLDKLISKLRNKNESLRSRETDSIAEIDKLRKSVSNLKTRNTQHQNDDTTTRHVPKAKSKDIIFLHDSLGKAINDTLLSREKVSVEKVLTYTLEKASEKLHTLNNNVSQTDKPRAIVVHVGTNNLDDEPDVIVGKLDSLINTCKSIAPKVVISNIVTRADNHLKNYKVDLVNAMINMKYHKDKAVVICRNNNLVKSHLTQKGVHLTDKGTARLANNLKYSIAGAVGVDIVKRGTQTRP